MKKEILYDESRCIVKIAKGCYKLPSSIGRRSNMKARVHLVNCDQELILNSIKAIKRTIRKLKKEKSII